MRVRKRPALILTFLGLAALAGLWTFQKTEDEKLLETLLRDFLFDPQGAERVKVTLIEPSWHEGLKEVTREGWLVRDKAGDRVYFTDGDSIPAPPEEKITKVDFIDRCKLLYATEPDSGRDDRFILLRLLDRVRGVDRGVGMRRSEFPLPSGGVRSASSRKWDEESDLVLAAWLFRLGEKNLATRVMRFVQPDREDEVAILRKSLARDALHRMYKCYMHYQDEAALANGERLLRLYPAEAGAYEQARPFIEDLKRRERQGTFGKKGEQQLPKEFAGWDANKKVAFLIESLDGIDPWDWKGEKKPHVDVLIQLGEPAVPALIDALERDERMTRGVRGPWKWEPIPRVELVREILLSVLHQILRVGNLTPRTDEESNTWRTWRTIPELKNAATVARAYWKEFRRLPYEERLMRVLTDEQSSREAKRDAADKLAFNPGEDKRWPYEYSPHLVKDHVPNRAILAFQGPTAAEAVLSVLDHDLAQFDALQEKKNRSRTYLVNIYFSSLIRIGDRRIAPELARRAKKEPDERMRLYWAHASHRLGDSLPLRQYARDFGEGKILCPNETGESPSDLERNIEFLGSVRLAEVDQALHRLTDGNHPLHAALVKGLFQNAVLGIDTRHTYLSHPSGVSILRELLDDETATGITYQLVGDYLHHSRPGGAGSYGAPSILKDPSKRKTTVEVRNCDAAGEKLTWVVAGLPEFHPLLNDAADRLCDDEENLGPFRGPVSAPVASRGKANGRDAFRPRPAAARPAGHRGGRPHRQGSFPS